ncbi:MAG: NAD(P)(+) transhydrogenase (Re/Si-specific) subunit alpha, partial [Verrucomicrobiota bacterium]
MKVGIAKEIFPGERRVSATPDTVARLLKMGCEVLVESGAGTGAAFPDDHYEKAGARMIDSSRELWDQSDVVLKVRPPEANEVDFMSAGKVLICFVW